MSLNAEISLLAGLGQNRLWLNNPWQYPGFTELASMFLKGHTVLMGREAWFDFPLKEDVSITPWVLSHNQYFQMYTKARYPHVRFVDTCAVLQRVIPEKGIWWVLGGHFTYREILPYAHSVEATIVTGAMGHVDLLKPRSFMQTHTCPHPLRSTLECIRYERQYITPRDIAFQVQQMQAN
jgi:dihydrofolate reductase